ncbi:MAG: hypothetical protein PHP64_01575 [Actinomycetota bacterium]|nr:hypothetical protein [Actinomycetota bacterium]
MSVRKTPAAIVLLCVVFLLVFLMIMGISCGKKTETRTSGESVSTDDAKNTIDQAIIEFEAKMKSIDPSDFNDAPLNDI